MNKEELNKYEIDIDENELLKLDEFCQKEKITKNELEQELYLVIFCKMCYEQENKLSIKNEDIKKIAPKLEELFSKLGLPCNHFTKMPILDTYDELKIHIIVNLLNNNYGYLDNDYNSFNLNIDRYEIINKLKKYRKFENIIDIGYRIITDKPLIKEEQIETDLKVLTPLIDNIDLINLVSNANEHEAISFKKYFELFIEYQDYLKQKIKEIFYYEYVDEIYDNISIVRYLTDSKSSVINIQFDGNISKIALFEKENKDGKIRYIWDKSKIITRERTLIDLFDFVENNETYYNRKNNFFYPSTDQSLSILVFNENIDKYRNIGITFEYGCDYINIKSLYIDGKMNYELNINGTTINILNEDIEPILENLYINIDYLPQYMQDFIELKEIKNKRKKRKIKVEE